MSSRVGRAYLVGAFLAMFLTAEGTALGAAVPTITRVTGVDVALVGQLAVAHGLGSLLGILVWGRVQGRWPARRAVAVGAACMLAGALAVAANPASGTDALGAGGMPLLLVLAGSLVVVGTGFGILVTAVNTVAAQAGMSPAMLNALHGTFGVGAIGFPVLAGRTDLGTVFVVVVVLAAVATPLLLRTPPVRRAPPSSTAGRAALPFVLFIGVAVSLEIGISVWAPTHLVAEGRGVEAAATVVGIYFGAFTATRFAVAPLAARWDLGRLVRWSVALAGAASLAAAVLPEVGWIVAGIGIGPLFPTTLAWMARATGDDHAATRLYLGAMIGGLVGPGALGIVVGVVGPAAIPVALAALAVLGWLLARALPDVRDAVEVTAAV